jgi:hypothetical protein
MLLGICKEKIEKLSADFANACTSAQIRQTVCYGLGFYYFHFQRFQTQV